MIKNYNEYQYSQKEWIRYFIEGLVISTIVGLLFYSNIIGVILLSPFGFYYVKMKRKEIIEKRKWQLNLEFRDSLLSISSALNAGYSIENAFEQTVEDLKVMYPKEALIIREFESMVNQIKMNITIEKVLLDFAERSTIEDIANFSAVFTTAKRTGGDLIKIIRNTSNTIGDKIEIKREILTMITAKKFESKVMAMIPFCIILYLRFFSPGFLNPLYNNIIGFLIMSVLLVIYLFAYRIADKIMRIEV